MIIRLENKEKNKYNLKFNIKLCLTNTIYYCIGNPINFK